MPVHLQISNLNQISGVSLHFQTMRHNWYIIDRKCCNRNLYNTIDFAGVSKTRLPDTSDHSLFHLTTSFSVVPLLAWWYVTHLEYLGIRSRFILASKQPNWSMSMFSLTRTILVILNRPKVLLIQKVSNIKHLFYNVIWVLPFNHYLGQIPVCRLMPPYALSWVCRFEKKMCQVMRY